MSADSEGLHEIANTKNGNRKADIVFVHGLGGGSHSTWRHGHEGEAACFFWPSELGRTLPECGIWTLGHSSGISHWFSEEGMAIEDRAANFALKLCNADIGKRPLIFLTHSMGGLVVKEFLTAAVGLGGKDWANVASAVRGVVFLGTPHHGAYMAAVAKGFAVLLRTQEHLKQMKFAAPALDQLHKRFTKWQSESNCPTESYVETKGIARNNWLSRLLLPRVVVVPRISGDPQIPSCDCHPIGADHTTLVKPDSTTHDVYAGVLRFIQKALIAAPPAASLSPSAPTDGAISEIRQRLIAAKEERELQALLLEAQALNPTAQVRLLIADIEKALEHTRRVVCFANERIAACDISRILKYAPEKLIGRESDLSVLSVAWEKVQRAEKGRPHVLTFVALGGEGKTSLVAKWAAELAAQDWPGCDAAFAWSFYSQGTREQLAASSDLFLKEALTFFATDEKDEVFAASSAGAFEKGQRLARLIGQRRSLLILDGLEPLQYAPTSPTRGQLKDQGIAALLRALAAASHGLCIVTTRYSLPDLKAFWQTTAPEVKLLRLSREAGVHLLKTLGVCGTVQEFATLVEDVKGHALTLTLLGGFLKRAFHGDIRQRDRVKFEKADEKMDGGHAFRTMAAYEQWLLRDGGDEGRREVAVLRLLGLFDRPADAGCLAALRSETIPDLTEPLAGLVDDDWEFCLSGLEAAKLLTVNRDASGALISLDAHPHLREYFARQLREQQPDAWRAAHRRLYEHLCATTPDNPQPALEDLQPLYQAVAHGCQAGLWSETRENIYCDRIHKGNDYYSQNKLGVFGSDLGAVVAFFEAPWSRVSSTFNDPDQCWLLMDAAFCLRALGRLAEALEPMSVVMESDAKHQRWKRAAQAASNLSELELSLGEVAGAVGDAEQSVTYADRSGDWFQQEVTRTTHANALHQAGRRADALESFREAEQMHAKDQPDYPLLYSLRGFCYCDLLLATPERVAWQTILSLNSQPSTINSAVSDCRSVSQRAAQTLKWEEGIRRAPLLDFAFHHLTQGCAVLYVAILSGGDAPVASSHADQRRGVAATLESARRELDAAMADLRRAGTQHFIPTALLTRAWLRFLAGARIGPESAQEDLDEAWEIAERGPMKLHMADIHLHRARLFFREKPYPWKSPEDDLTAAEKLINDCGYHRRDEELADAKQAILGC